MAVYGRLLAVLVQLGHVVLAEGGRSRCQQQNNEISKQGYHFLGNEQFSVGFWGPEDQKCILRVLLRLVVWRSKILFLRVLTKIKFFFSQITHNREHIKN